MKPLTMNHVSLCPCGRGVVQDSEGECRQCREDALRRVTRFDAPIDVKRVKVLPMNMVPKMRIRS